MFATVIMANHIVVKDDRNAAKHLTDEDIKVRSVLNLNFWRESQTLPASF